MIDLSEIEDLFKYNLRQVAYRFGLIEGATATFPMARATKILNIAEELSFAADNEARLMSLLLCALIWENRLGDWPAIRPFIGRILIRLGLGTTAKMVNWDRQFNVFSSLGSLINELSATVKLMEYEVRIGDHKIVLSDFQKRMWQAIDQHTRVGISAPTSAGKSFVLVNKTLEILSREEGRVIYIVPTISLINQVCTDLRKKIREYGLSNIYVSQTVNDSSLFGNGRMIYVLTQERAAAALNHPNADFSNLKLLIVDEIQNVEKVTLESEERSKILYDVIQVFKNDMNPEKIIISGPRLENISDLVRSWFGEGAKSVSEELPAVINITYSFKTARKRLEFQQFLPPNIVQSIDITDNFRLKEKILKRVRYFEEEYNFIASIVNRNKADGNIIFSDTTAHANEIALAIADKLDNQGLSGRISGIQNFIESTVHPMYSLIQSVEKGVAFHHGKMPNHIRSLVEKLFSLKLLNTIVSTTTLMQGVNLPAKNIIIRNPKIGDESLTGYEFANLKGRAGRLMKDFIGRALVIDEKRCAEASIALGVSAQKDLNVGYATRFERDKDDIVDILTNNRVSTNELNNDLVTYIRNMCIRYEEAALNRIREVGISLPEELFTTTLESVANLAVPRNICLSNFYWDPLLLNRLYLSYASREWTPVPINIVGSAHAIHELVVQMASFAPHYFEKYLGSINVKEEYGSRKILSLCIYAESFGSGRPLKDVIDPVNFPVKVSSDIDDRIDDLHTKVVYGIPKLLKPLLNIADVIDQRASSQILSFIEVGGVDPKLRALIEIGVPRETAIAMLRTGVPSTFVDADGMTNERRLQEFVRESKNSPQLNEWHKLLIEDI